MQPLVDLFTGALAPGVYRCNTRTSAAAILRLAQQHGWRVYRLDGREIAGKAEFLSASARALCFPGYFGHNWDAFEESLNDFAAEADGRVLVLFDHASRFAAAAPEAFATALEILAAAAARRQIAVAPLVVLVRGAGRAAPDLPAVQESA